MRTLLFTTLLVLVPSVFAEVIDVEVDPIKVFTCQDPTARTDGVALTLSEISHYTVLLSTDNVNFQAIPGLVVSPGNCTFTIDYTEVAAGDYHYVMRTIDTENRTSVNSNVVDVTVVRPVLPVTTPNPPVLILGQVLQGGGTYGPLNQATVFEASPQLQAIQHIEITATLNTVGAKQGLFSRDQSGQAESGHLNIYVESNGTITVRNQGLTQTVSLNSGTSVLAGTEFTVAVSVSPAGLALSLNGVLAGSDPTAYLLTGNNLPLVIGGDCLSCTATDITPINLIDGVILVRTYDAVI